MTRIKPLTLLTIVLIATGVLFAGLFLIVTVTGEADIDVEYVYVDQEPIVITQTITQPTVTFTDEPPDQTTPPYQPPITTTQQIIPYLKYSQTGTGSILDVNGKVLEEWQMNPLASVYESAYGHTWKINIRTRIESNIIDWSTLKVRHNVFLVCGSNLVSVLFNEETSLNNLINDDTWYIAKTYTGPLARFSEVGVSSYSFKPSTVRVVIYNLIWHTDDIRGGYIKNRDFTDKALIVSGFQTTMFMDAGNPVIMSAVEVYVPQVPSEYDYLRANVPLGVRTRFIKGGEGY